jgi:hypothetical protein
MQLMGRANWWMPNWTRVALRVPVRTATPAPPAPAASQA